MSPKRCSFCDKFFYVEFQLVIITMTEKVEKKRRPGYSPGPAHSTFLLFFSLRNANPAGNTAEVVV